MGNKRIKIGVFPARLHKSRRKAWIEVYLTYAKDKQWVLLCFMSDGVQRWTFSFQKLITLGKMAEKYFGYAFNKDISPMIHDDMLKIMKEKDPLEYDKIVMKKLQASIKKREKEKDTKHEKP